MGDYPFDDSGDPSGWDGAEAALLNSPAMFRSPMAPGIGSMAGRTLGGYERGDHGGGHMGGGLAADISYRGYRNPRGSYPSVTVGVANHDPAANPNIPLLDAKTEGLPTSKDIASATDITGPDYSQVYALDEEIRKREKAGPSLVDLFGQEILGHDFANEKLAGMYRTRDVLRKDAESKFANYLRANQDPEELDKSAHYQYITDALGNVTLVGVRRNGKPYMKVVGTVAVKDPNQGQNFSQPVEEEDTGYTITGRNPDGSARYLTRPGKPVEVQGPQTEKEINTGEGDFSPQRPVDVVTPQEKVKTKKETAPPSQAALDRAALEREKLDEKRRADAVRAAEKAGQNAVDRLRGGTGKVPSREEEDRAYRQSYDETYEQVMTGKAPKREAAETSKGKTLRFSGYDDKGKPIYK